MDDIGDFLIAPVQSWDALVCASQASRTVVLEVLDRWSAYLSDRFARAPKVSLQFPVIPLGIDCTALSPTPQSQALRHRFRREHGIADTDVALLFAGRLSMTSKVHPVPMWMGAEMAAQRSPVKLHIVMAGWFENKSLEQEFQRGISLYCPSVNVVFVNGISDPIYRPTWAAADIWTVADIFISLSDNVQESFGLTPIEAMAAGLPCIVSDWDGYRESVIDGETGIHIPILAPPPGAGEDLARRWSSDQSFYGQYVGGTALSTAVDLQAYADALIRLATDQNLRLSMGMAGQQRARRTFDWSVIIPQYEMLWSELAARRAAEEECVPRRMDEPAEPLRGDPYAVFASFASAHLQGTHTLRCPHADPARALASVTASRLNTFAVDVLLPVSTMQTLLIKAREHAISIQAIIDQIPARERQRALRSVGWLLKMGLLVARSGGR
jgi:glycosyltransferase involved in cell wall biosynthesis